MMNTIKTVSDEFLGWQRGDAHYFTGDYVSEMLSVALISLITEMHASFQAAPGWGKTDVLDTFAAAVAGQQRYQLIAVTPASNPSIFEGELNPKAYLEEGRKERIVEGTPYDPNMRVVLADEFARGNDATFDAALHALDPKKQNHCLVWATNNWLPKGERIEATLDRIGLYWWHDGEAVDVEQMLVAMMGSHGKPQLPCWIPTWEQIETVRAARPTPNSIAAVKATIAEVVSEALREGMVVGHPRNMAQWWKIVFYGSVLHTGTEDFAVVPDAARRMLRYAFGARTHDEAKVWARLVDAITDQVQAEIDRILGEAVVEFRKVANMDHAQRVGAIGGLGVLIANAQQTLHAQFADSDPRTMTAIMTMQQWFTAAMQGNAAGI
jgi:MoxR-like ATPase